MLYTIILGEDLLSMLEQSRNGGGYVIKSFARGSSGGCLSPGTVYKFIKKIAIRAGYPKLKPHDLRRIYAGEFLRLSKDPASLKEQLGHSDISTTLSCYTVPTKKKKQPIVNGFELRG